MRLINVPYHVGHRAQVFGRSLTTCDAYRDYENQLKNYDRKRFRMRFWPIVGTLAFTTWGVATTPRTRSKIDEYRDLALHYRDIHDNTISQLQIDKSAEQFELYKRKHGQAVWNYNIRRVGVPLVAAAGVWYILRSYKRSGKLAVPTYIDKPQLTFNYFPGPGNNQSLTLALTIPL